jgi:hypothetical protein
MKYKPEYCNFYADPLDFLQILSFIISFHDKNIASSAEK